MGNELRRSATLSGFAAVVLMASSAQAGQQPPPVNGTVAIEGTVDSEYKAANTVIVKTLDGVKHLFHLTSKTDIHGGDEAGAEALKGLDSGSKVVVRYAPAAGEQTALEVDRVDDKGLKKMEGVVTRVDRPGRTISVRLADGTSQTLRLTDRAATDVREVDEAPADSTRVVVYYTNESGQRVAHYFKKVS